MSAQSNRSDENIDLPTGTEKKIDLREDLEYCRPHLMALKSPTLEKLEKMQKDAQKNMQENHNKKEEMKTN